MTDDLPPARTPDGRRYALGNKEWLKRATTGAKRKFATPEELAEGCQEYLDWVVENPLQEAKLVSHQGESRLENVPKLRAMTITGLCLTLGITYQTWRQWKKDRPDLADVQDAVEGVIYSQKFEGAAADLFNANIIARELGLSDKSEIMGKDGGPIETKDLSAVETARRIAFLLDKGVRAQEDDTSS